MLSTSSPTFLPQGFLFDWNPPGTTIPIPNTEQCETLSITWERGSTGVGPNPVSPYYLQISLRSTVPIIVPAGSGTKFDFQVPWIPGTQYQICMWDSTGVSGGCQNMYTVIPNSTATVLNPATCPNVTASAPLDVNALVVTGAFSQYGWPPQCTDIQVQPKNGTPPYTLTVAPTLHPPLNITSHTNDPINWTISLTHGFPFFISLMDSQGLGWVQGPLHSGENVDTSCLNVDHSGGGSSSHMAGTIGAGVGGVVVGLIAGIAGILAFLRCRGNRRNNICQRHQYGRCTGLEYVVEPFSMPSSTPGGSDPHFPLLSGGPLASPPASAPDATSASGSDPVDQSTSGGGRRQNVYVVHHDGGPDADVVELPPRYANSGSGGASDGHDQPRRAAGSATQKGRGPRPG
ncbi:hypothetical protein BGW80DRAFT_1433648 [Lactifluus volemus]|nr:hypothetical protein BGW80DRAFT_1433648 [Lactifluus volemus]